MDSFTGNMSDSIYNIERLTYYSEPANGISEYLMLSEAFDRNGKKNARILFSQKGEKISSEKWVYDSLGYPVAKETLINDKKTIMNYTYKLDSEGRLSSLNGSDEKSNLAMIVKYQSDGTYWESHYTDKQLYLNKEFNRDKLLVTEYNFLSKTNTINTYDTHKTLIRSEIIDGSSGFTKVESFHHTYNVLGKLTETNNLTSGCPTFFYYNTEGMVERLVQKGKRGKVMSISRFEYKAL